MKVKDKVYVIDWGKRYSHITRWNNETEQRENIYPIKTKIPDYSGIEFHWKYVYEPNITVKGTVNKREPRKIVEKIPIYKNYKWEILEIFKHPRAGQYCHSKELRDHWKDKGGMNDKYTEENLLLLASTHTNKAELKCYIIIQESGVSKLTPKQYDDKKFNAFIKSNLGKWDRNNLDKKNIPKELISKFYDKNDNVLFGASTTKGLVSYEYLDGKFSTDEKPIYISTSILYDGKGNKNCPNPELIKDFDWIKKYLKK